MGQLNKMAEIALVCKTNYSMYEYSLLLVNGLYLKNTPLTSQSSYLLKF